MSGVINKIKEAITQRAVDEKEVTETKNLLETKKYIENELKIHTVDGDSIEITCNTIKPKDSTLIMASYKEFGIGKTDYGYNLDIKPTKTSEDSIHLSRLRSSVKKSIEVLDAKIIDLSAEYKRKKYRAGDRWRYDYSVDDSDVETETKPLLMKDFVEELWERERISGLQRDLLYQYLKKEAR